MTVIKFLSRKECCFRYFLGCFLTWFCKRSITWNQSFLCFLYIFNIILLLRDALQCFCWFIQNIVKNIIESGLRIVLIPLLILLYSVVSVVRFLKRRNTYLHIHQRGLSVGTPRIILSSQNMPVEETFLTRFKIIRPPKSLICRINLQAWSKTFYFYFSLMLIPFKFPSFKQSTAD